MPSSGQNMIIAVMNLAAKIPALGMCKNRPIHRLA